MAWSSYPPEHKRSFFRALALYCVVLLLCAGWIGWNYTDSVRKWNARVPQAVAPVTTIYETPQITEASPEFQGTAPPPGAGEGYISIIMTDAGLSDAATARAIDDLPAPVALAFSPYAPKLDAWLKKAATAQRESLILLPMEPESYPKDDPGPQALLARLPEKENRRNLDWIMTRSEGTLGAMNFMGSAFLADDRAAAPVFKALKARGAMFVEDPVAPATALGQDTAKEAGLSYLAADLRIDATATELAVKQQLLNLENIAYKRGYAVGIAQPYPLTFNILKDWAQSLDRRGIRLVPLTAIWQTKVQHEKAAAQQQEKE